MTLTRTERSILNLYLSYMERPPAFLRLLKFASRKILTMAAASAFLGYVFFSNGYRQSGCLLFGIGIGAISRQLGQLRLAVIAARLLPQVMDRDKIKRLLDEGEAGVS